MVLEPRRKSDDSGSKQCETDGEYAGEGRQIAKHRARRPIERAAELRCHRSEHLRSQDVDTRQRPIGQDRAYLQPDHEGCADHRRQYLRDQPGPLRANALEKANRKRDRNCYRGEAEPHNDCVGAQPSRPAAPYKRLPPPRPGSHRQSHRPAS